MPSLIIATKNAGFSGKLRKCPSYFPLDAGTPWDSRFNSIVRECPFISSGVQWEKRILKELEWFELEVQVLFCVFAAILESADMFDMELQDNTVFRDRWITNLLDLLDTDRQNKSVWQAFYDEFLGVGWITFD